MLSKDICVLPSQALPGTVTQGEKTTEDGTKGRPSLTGEMLHLLHSQDQSLSHTTAGGATPGTSYRVLLHIHYTPLILTSQRWEAIPQSGIGTRDQVTAQGKRISVVVRTCAAHQAGLWMSQLFSLSVICLSFPWVESASRFPSLVPEMRIHTLQDAG